MERTQFFGDCLKVGGNNRLRPTLGVEDLAPAQGIGKDGRPQRPPLREGHEGPIQSQG